MTNFILEYYQAIKDGTETTGEWIKKWYSTIIKGIEEKKYFFNPKKAWSAITFCENFCRHSEGPLGGQKMRLELWQKAFLSVIFGITDEKGLRQFTEVVVIIGRKNGKTLLAAAIAAYCAFIDGEYGGRVYFAAPKLEQAQLCFNAFQQIILTEPMLNKISKKRRTDIYIDETNTMAKPLAFSEKKSDGLNVSLCVADEIAAWNGDPGLKFYEVIKSSFGARKQPLLLSISTSGYINDGIFDELVKRSTRVILGETQETHLAPFLYTIDDVQKWNDINELNKANPNLGVSVSIDYMLGEIAIAEGSFSKKSEFLTKYCNIKQNSSQAWLNAQDIERCFGPALDIKRFSRCYGMLGVDLSRTTDLTAAVMNIELDGQLYLFAHFWLPANKIAEATARDGIPYDVYIKRGELTPSGDNFVDYHDCFNWIRQWFKNQIAPLYCMYDRYSAQYLIQDITAAGLACDDCYQGENMTPCIRELEGRIKDGTIHAGDNQLLKIHLLNSALKLNTETERVKLIKMNATAHVDGTAALLNTIAGRQKWWNEYGAQLSNAGKKYEETQ